MPFELSDDAIKSALSQLSLRTQAFINGSFRDSVAGRQFSTENPATGQCLAEIAACGSEDVNEAVQAARAAFIAGSWSRAAPDERKIKLIRLAELIEEHQIELALLDCLEAGKPIQDCVDIDLVETVDCFRWHAEVCDKLYDQVAPTGPDHLGLIRREPVGVVGAVVPWNFPLLMATWKLAPALAAGNSVILKPAELTSLSALRLAELAAAAGIPDGVFNVVSGLGPEAGEPIGRHHDIDMVAFTGSTEVGRLFLKYSAESNLKRVVLECGGKSPQVVFADAPDLDYVAEQAASAAFWNMGENCSCGSRLIVAEELKDPLLERLQQQAATWTVGDPLDPSTRLGAMIEQAHLDKVMNYIQAGLEEGAQLVVGGKRIREESGGYFVEPTIFDQANNRMTIAREEIFGPVLSTLTFRSEQEAIELANDSDYGLAASVYTRDIDVAHRVAGALRAGTVSVNCFSEGNIATPFGGYKLSGFAGRDKSIHAHRQYTELKTIWIELKH